MSGLPIPNAIFPPSNDTPKSFVVPAIYVGALALMALAMWQITGDGEAVLFEGLALVALYVVLATLVWFE